MNSVMISEQLIKNILEKLIWLKYNIGLF